MQSGSCKLATPVALELQDGIKDTETEKTTLVDKMSALCVQFLRPGSYIILDAYFAAKKVIAQLRQHQLHLITRVKISTVGKYPTPAPPLKRGPGRPRTWGESVKLRNLFKDKDSLTTETLLLYGKMKTVSYRTIDLHWDCPNTVVRFVLAVWPEGKQIILLSTDVTLSAAEILRAYSWRFKIEVTFRTLIELLSGFSYRFWMKDMVALERQPKDLIINQYQEEKQQQFKRKVEAFERFVNVNAIAMGILQILSLEMPNSIWKYFPGWFRTLPKNGYPSEQIVRLTIIEIGRSILAKSRQGLLLTKFRTERLQVVKRRETESFVC